jgi:cysteine-S-conjugate beta-lyase
VKYNFDRICNRKGTDSLKWDTVRAVFGQEDVIPMWIADMDFPSPRPVVEALKRRAEHPCYGYTKAGSGVVESVVERMERKFHWRIKPEWIVFTPGLIPALHVAVRTLTHPGDEVILQEPVYYPFFRAITGSGCQIVNNGLRLVKGQYKMDFEDLESKFHPKGGMLASDSSKVKAIMLCNPHNPVCRVWTKEDLVQMGEIAIRYGVVVISDEIHCEIVFKGYRHTPFASISKEFEQSCIICMSPSKSFNLAGLEVSTIIIPNERIRNEFSEMRSGILPSPNLFGYVALEAAYRFGDEWLEQVLEYLQGNLDFMLAFFAEKVPKIKVIPPQGTYLIWMDCRGLGMDCHSLKSFMCGKAKVGLNDGILFGAAGSGFQRINIACPRSTLGEALKRIEKAVNGI